MAVAVGAKCYLEPVMFETVELSSYKWKNKKINKIRKFTDVKWKCSQ